MGCGAGKGLGIPGLGGGSKTNKITEIKFIQLGV